VGVDICGEEENGGSCCLRLLPCTELGGASVPSTKRQILQWVPWPLALLAYSKPEKVAKVLRLWRMQRLALATTHSWHLSEWQNRWIGTYRDIWHNMDEISCLSWCGESWKLVSHPIRWYDGWQQRLGPAVLPAREPGRQRPDSFSSSTWAILAAALIVPPLLLQAIGCTAWGELHVLDLAATAESEFEDNISKNMFTFLSSISACCFLPGGQHLVCGAQDGTIFLLDHETGLQLHSVRVHQRRITSLSCGQQAGLLAAGDERGFVSVWDLADGCFTMVQLCR
jgi:hypothetical protein